MTVATFQKINQFVEDLGRGVHNLGSDTLTIALTTMANKPVATNNTLSELTQISYTNLSSRIPTIISYLDTAGTAVLLLQDLVLTASGAVAPFGVVVLYNATSVSNPLIGWWEYGSDVTLLNTQTFVIGFDAINGGLKLS